MKYFMNNRLYIPNEYIQCLLVKYMKKNKDYESTYYEWKVDAKS